MWPVTEAARRWYESMADQDIHEQFDCPPCLLNGVPMCREGLRLQQAARAAHAALISNQYAGRAVSV